MTVDERFDRLDDAIGDLKRSISDLTGYVLDFRQETATRFQGVENRLEVFATTFASHGSRFPAMTKSPMDFGADHSALMCEQWKLKDTNTGLVARVERLEEIVSKLIKPAA
jgi:hypothetical protein